MDDRKKEVVSIETDVQKVILPANYWSLPGMLSKRLKISYFNAMKAVHFSTLIEVEYQEESEKINAKVKY